MGPGETLGPRTARHANGAYGTGGAGRPLSVSPEFAAVLGALAAALVMHLVVRGRASRRGRRAARRGLGAETAAERLLERAGYRVVDRQVTGTWPIAVNGEVVDAPFRVDLAVTRRRRRYLVEVKTGPAARPTHPDTRRQLLEYFLALRCDGLLLVDMDAREIHEIDFPALRGG